MEIVNIILFIKIVIQSNHLVLLTWEILLTSINVGLTTLQLLL